MLNFFKRKRHSDADTEDFAKQLGLRRFGMYPNKYDAYQKIEKIIQSCKTFAQVRCVGELIYRFNQYYDDPYLFGVLKMTEEDVWWNLPKIEEVSSVEDSDKAEIDGGDY